MLTQGDIQFVVQLLFHQYREPLQQQRFQPLQDAEQQGKNRGRSASSYPITEN